MGAKQEERKGPGVAAEEWRAVLKMGEKVEGGKRREWYLVVTRRGGGGRYVSRFETSGGWARGEELVRAVLGKMEKLLGVIAP